MFFGIGANFRCTGIRMLAFSLVLAATATASPADAGLADGIAAYKRGDYGTARAEWEPAAEAGDLDAIFNLGQLYRLGKGVPRDLDRAVRYYRRAAEAGHVAAQGNLGTLYYFSLPGAPHVADALSWWEMAAAAGDARSQYLLGVLYFNGSHVPRNYARAYGWTLLAARAGLAEAIAAEKTMLEYLSLDEIENGKAMAESLPEEVRAQGSMAADEEPPLGTAVEPEAPQSEIYAPGITASPMAGSWDGFYVQLMAMQDPLVAERTISRLRREYGDVLDESKLRLRLPRSERARYYRLLLGPFGSPAQAGSRCVDLQAHGIDCFVTAERD